MSFITNLIINSAIVFALLLAIMTVGLVRPARPRRRTAPTEGPDIVDWGAQRRLDHLFFYFVNVDTVRVTSGPHAGRRITIVTPSRWWGDHRGAAVVNAEITHRLGTGWRWK